MAGTETEAGGDDALFLRLKQDFKAAADFSHEWREEARRCYAFRDGDQWSEEDRAQLREQLRPCITFNRIGSVIDSVAGLEVNNRQETRFIPRRIGDAPVDEVLTEAGKWVRDECEAEDEESDAFLDMATCGMGWTDTRMDYDDDPDGMAIIRRVDPLEMYWDPSARRKNLGDGRFIFRVREIPIEEARQFSDEDDPAIADLDAGWADDLAATTREPHDAQQAPFYRNDQSARTDLGRQTVRIVEAQWWEFQTSYRVADQATGQVVELSEGDHAKLTRRMAKFGLPVVSAKQRKKVFRKAFLGAKLLRVVDGADEGGFSLKAMTAKRDRNKGTWYGLVRAMIDPQMWANKWLSQTLHIINTNAKGGVLAEEDAFDNVANAEDSWADPSAITWVKAGALSQNKIQPKPQVEFPASIQNLMEFAISSIRDVSGVNLELLGMVDREQPGILEAQRKQAGLTILAGLFDSLRKYRKEQGRLLLYFITKFMADGRLVRVVDKGDARYIPLIHQPGVAKYDVVVDETPTSPNMKERTWSILLQMLPILRGMPMPPPVFLEMLRYSPLPESLIAKIDQMSQQQAQNPPPPDPKMIVAQAQAQESQARTAEYQARAGAHQADAQAAVMKAYTDALAGQATIEQKRAAAALALHQAGAVRAGANIDAFNAAVDAMLGLHNAAMQAMPPPVTPQPNAPTPAPAFGPAAP